jgi:hypothetical protein
MLAFGAICDIYLRLKTLLLLLLLLLLLFYHLLETNFHISILNM